MTTAPAIQALGDGTGPDIDGAGSGTGGQTGRAAEDAGQLLSAALAGPERGIPQGSFLTALRSNDLKEAFRCADETNAKAMREWVRFVVNQMPSENQGNPERVAAWIARGGLSGEPPQADAGDKP